MTYCETSTIVNSRPGEIRIRPLRCRCWSCPDCQPDRVKDLRTLARRGEPTRFITLTSRPDTETTPAERAQRLVNAWRVIRRRLARLHPNAPTAFLAVIEETKRGEPHLHILARGPFVAQSWLSAAMDALTGAPIVHVRHVDNPGRAAAYVAKYVAKAPARFAGCKRYWRSQDYAIQPPRWCKPILEAGWHSYRIATLVVVVKDWLIAEGWTMTAEGRGWRSVRAPP